MWTFVNRINQPPKKSVSKKTKKLLLVLLLQSCHKVLDGSSSSIILFKQSHNETFRGNDSSKSSLFFVDKFCVQLDATINGVDPKSNFMHLTISYSVLNVDHPVNSLQISDFCLFLEEKDSSSKFGVIFICWS